MAFFTHPEDIASGTEEMRNSRIRHYIHCHQDGRMCHCGGKPPVDKCAVDAVIATHPKSVDIEDVCSICCDKFEPPVTNFSQLQCNHIFHTPCIKDWLYDNPNCPNCRQTVTTEYSKCLICEATGTGEKAGIEGAFQCCGFRTHVTCWTAIYATLKDKRCPGCQKKNPMFANYYNINPAELTINHEALSKIPDLDVGKQSH